jgi:hypothetical protein
MEMQQVMEMLLKEIKAGQEQMVTKLDANRKKNQERRKEEMEATRKKDEDDFLAKLEFNQEQTNIIRCTFSSLQFESMKNKRK